ncbi:MAG TPA: WG repeat-containing protein, partial [Phaeodactylibacter sp.]|nr:WG repeat-containing protein [Phaeodactylibacter sp.]
TAEKIIAGNFYEDYLPFSDSYVLALKDKKLALLDAQGNSVLAPAYEEISIFADSLFRVRKDGLWGIVDFNDEVVLAIDYQYIAPVEDNFFTVKKNGNIGLMNRQYEWLIPAEYSRIQHKDRQVKAFKGKAMTLYSIDENGNLQDQNSFQEHFTIRIGGLNRRSRSRMRTIVPWGGDQDYLLDNFEWFYSTQRNRWGLRRLDDGTVQIAPTFYSIRIVRDLGMTIVGIEKINYLDFERTSYRFYMTYGIVNNEVGRLVSKINMLDIRLSDFYEQQSRVARCIFEDGTHGLISRKPIGKILLKSCSYIGDYQDGLARVSFKGKLSATMDKKKTAFSLGALTPFLDSLRTPYSMIDYTLYDQRFQKEAQLYCEDCLWGFVDTLGQVQVVPEFAFVKHFENEAAIVLTDDKWGLINKKGELLLQCRYDGIEYLENTNKQIFKVFVNQKKYGLIDSTGNLAIKLQYDALRKFREGRIALKRNGKWGFANADGEEVIPCRFRKVNDFHEGLATVKLNRKWGVIDLSGKVVLDFDYRKLGNFQNGLAWVHTSKGYGYINSQGQFIIAPQYRKAFDFENGVARVMSNGKYGLIDT